MRVQVVRVGQSAGELFAEVQHSPDGQHLSGLRYSVPLAAEVEVGTILEVTVAVVETPQQAATEKREPTIISHMSPEPLQVPTSPIVGDTDLEAVDTSPSGQSTAIPPTSPSEPELADRASSGEDLGNDASDDEGDEKKLKQGKLPKSFPHQAELEEAGVTTYAQARALNGNYDDVHNVGASRGSEIDAALNE